MKLYRTPRTNPLACKSLDRGKKTLFSIRGGRPLYPTRVGVIDDSCGGGLDSLGVARLTRFQITLTTLCTPCTRSVVTLTTPGDETRAGAGVRALSRADTGRCNAPRCARYRARYSERAGIRTRPPPPSGSHHLYTPLLSREKKI